MKNQIKLLPFFCVLFLVALTRLPFLLDPYLTADGDESIVGLMAKHILEGKAFPLFFYGQDYGISLFESLTLSLFFKMFGISTLSLKAGILMLWTLGVFLFFNTMVSLFNPKQAWVALLLLCFCPAWFIWSMKARGFYITGFLFTQIFFSLLVTLNQSKEPLNKNFFLIGFTIPILYYSQPIWFLSVIPFLFLLVKRMRSFSNGFWLVLGCSFPILCIQTNVFFYGLSSSWDPPFFTHIQPWINLKNFPYHLFITFTGRHEYSIPFSGLFLSKISAWIWSILLLFSLIGIFLYPRKEKFYYRASCGGILIVCLFSLFFQPNLFAFRYLLPVTFWILIPLSSWFFLGLNHPNSIIRFSLGILFLFLLIIGFSSIKELNPSKKFLDLDSIGSLSPIQKLTKELVQNQIWYVYSLDPCLQWQIMFYSGELIQARCYPIQDRLPSIPFSVDQKFFRGHKTAAVGNRFHSFILSQQNRAQNHTQIKMIAESYSILENPKKDFLESLGFIFNPKK